jgi:hypothetical protein
MKRPPRAVTSRMKRLIETVLAPGRFVSYHATFSFVSDLGTVEHELARLMPTAPAQAVALYETFLAGCHEKAEEIDDSRGSLGQFVAQLYCGWIKARQAAGADADDTVTRLFGWMEDDYGFCSHLEKDAAEALSSTIVPRKPSATTRWACASGSCLSIPTATCVEVRVPMSADRRMEYALAPRRAQFRIAAENPAKLETRRKRSRRGAVTRSSANSASPWRSSSASDRVRGNDGLDALRGPSVCPTLSQCLCSPATGSSCPFRARRGTRGAFP